ncbi:MAG TPA: type II toxin-antitoxin system Phd/YefM family antitoxin [Gemmataceae bacterium]|nr:type II toxin-antitoxin system Phd/YefM family antitoxin [Gemmataceae bacterium]
MKTFSLTDARENLEAILKTAQRERVVLTRDGKPSVVLLGVECYDEEELQLASSPEFWQFIEERRKDKGGLPLVVFKKRLEAREAKEREAKTSSDDGQRPAKGRASGSKPAGGKRQGGKGKR